MKESTMYICFVVLSLHLSIEANDAIYSWIDEQGKRHFSDKPSHKIQSDLFERQQLTTTKFIKSKLSFSSGRTHRKSRSGKGNSDKTNSVAKKEKICDSIRKTIIRLEKKLSTKLAPDKFDRYKQELNQVRWKKIRYC
ncbi:MAG: DUF4124 domain-containing protein [Kangiellaceae bacterium]|nr:DUF4124 domain-containing protein [Kangiellaceae bacterium]